VDNELFDDLVASCKEAIESEKGNTELKSTTIEAQQGEDTGTVPLS